MLRVENLHVSITRAERRVEDERSSATEGKEILRGIDLEIKPGQTHVIMGQNGSGKTTLAKVIAGQQEGLKVKGRVTFLGKSLLKMEPEKRAREGIFLAFQNPIEIPGVSLSSFLTASLNEIRKYRAEPLVDPIDFLNSIEEKAKISGLKKEFLTRGVNEGFSGGERKKNEIFQMQVLEPRLVILDEIDSGLDVDSLKRVAKAILKTKRKDNAFLIITHYQRILNYVKPDFVHIMVGGKIVKSGNYQLALEVEEKGYGHFY